MKAEINWLGQEDGGRPSPPLGVGTPPYATVVNILHSDVTCDSINAWSLVVEKVQTLDSELHWLAEVRFLVPEAPVEELKEGRKFELYEGQQRVAVGIILGEDQKKDQKKGRESNPNNGNAP